MLSAHYASSRGPCTLRGAFASSPATARLVGRVENVRLRRIVSEGEGAVRVLLLSMPQGAETIRDLPYRLLIDVAENRAATLLFTLCSAG